MVNMVHDNTYNTNGVNGAGDTNENNETATAIIMPSSVTASERTLLTQQQTYFADEKIPIPETENVICFQHHYYALVMQKK